MRSSSGLTLTLLINRERCDQINRPLQNCVPRDSVWRVAPSLLGRLGRVQFRICSGDERGFVQVWPFGFIDEGAHSFFDAPLKDLALVHRRHFDWQIRFYAFWKY